MDTNYIGSPLNFRHIEGQEFDSRNTFDLNATQNDETLRLYLRSAGLSDEIECLNVEQRRAFIYDIIRSNKLPGYWLPSTLESSMHSKMQRPSVRPPPPPPPAPLSSAKFKTIDNQPVTATSSADNSRMYQNTDFGSVRSNASSSSLHSLDRASPILPQRFMPAPTTPPSPSTFITNAKGITYEISAPTNFQHTAGDMTRDRTRNAFDLTGSSNDNVLRKYMMERGITEEDVAGMRKADIIRKIVQSKFTWMAEVWKYYDKIFDSKVIIAKCKNQDCGRLLCVADGNTTALRMHLKACRSIDIDARKYQNYADHGLGETQDQDHFDDEHEEIARAERIVKLLTVGVSINCLITSQQMRQMFALYRQDLPTSGKAVIEILNEFYDATKTEMKQRIRELYYSGERFSYSVEEWHGLEGKRYLHINLYGGSEIFNLGLIRIVGKGDVTIMKQLIEAHFLSFDVDIDKFVVGFSSDGCKFMKRFAQVASTEHSFCVLQIIHLAIMDFFYKQNIVEHEDGAEADTELEFEEVKLEVVEEEEDFGERDDFNSCFLIEKSEDDAEMSTNIRADFKESLQKMRTIIKYFRKSEQISAILEANMKTALGHELQLQLDCRGRWNTIPDMIKRFLICKEPIIETLQTFNKQHEFLNGLNFELMRDLAATLEPVRLATLRLAESNTSVAEAEIVMEVLINTLKNMDNQLASELGEMLKYRYIVGRNKELVSLMRYLRNPGILKETHTFLCSSKTAIHDRAKKIMKRLFEARYEEDISVEDAARSREEVEYCNASVVVVEAHEDNEFDNDYETVFIKREMTFLEELNEKLSFERKKKPLVSSGFQRELNDYDSSGIKSENLKLLQNALDNMQAHATEAERTFTISGKFSTKIRSSLSDETLNMLVFLKQIIKKE